MGAPSVDQLRLLYIVDRFTHSRNNNKRRWLKGLPLSVLVYRGIESKFFDDYDWAPSLVEFPRRQNVRKSQPGGRRGGPCLGTSRRARNPRDCAPGTASAA